MSRQTKAQQVLEVARQARAEAGSWIDVSNAVFALGGAASTLFQTTAERTAFSKTQEFAEIQAMIAEMRETKGDPPAIAHKLDTASGYMSIRLPKTVHAALLAEAELEGVSLNKLCVAKLCMQLRALL